MTLNTSVPSCQALPLQSQLTSDSTARLHGALEGAVWIRSTARLPRHTAGPLQVLKQALMEEQGKQGAEYVMPLVTTEICSFRGRQTQESPL